MNNCELSNLKYADCCKAFDDYQKGVITEDEYKEMLSEISQRKYEVK
jgi:hypothetical protein